MLGDIVPNNTNPNGSGAATAKGPIAQPEVGGYGTSDFGQANKPVASPASAPSPTTTPVAVASQPQAASVEAPSKKSGCKVTLTLTIVGVLVFIGGVAGLFIYALGGQ